MMGIRWLLIVLGISLSVLFAFPRVGQAAPLAVAPADHASALTLTNALRMVAIRSDTALKCPSVYRVRIGETLPAIAARCGVSTTAIMKANGLRSSRVWPGQRLYIPTPTPAQPPAEATRP
ncbi:MAG: LysM peptidoglycan-binding domain-containing protein [Anaerolineae bacterium]|nr:LysM peptidoglycan-binding domain-containing protein [Anaerolineae bacterium]